MLVAPFKIMDCLVSHVPIVGGVLHTLDTIPIRIKGTLNDVKVLPLAPSAVDYEDSNWKNTEISRPQRNRFRIPRVRQKAE